TRFVWKHPAITLRFMRSGVIADAACRLAAAPRPTPGVGDLDLCRHRTTGATRLAGRYGGWLSRGRLRCATEGTRLPGSRRQATSHFFRFSRSPGSGNPKVLPSHHRDQLPADSFPRRRQSHSRPTNTLATHQLSHAYVSPKSRSNPAW